MARPIPALENQKVRTSVSLTRKVVAAAERFRKEDKPKKNFGDFSEMVTAALVEYLEKYHPGLLDAVIAELRAQSKIYPETAHSGLHAAEEGAAAVTAGLRAADTRSSERESKGPKRSSRGGRK